MSKIQVIEPKFFVGQNVKLRNKVIVALDTNLVVSLPKGMEFAITKIEINHKIEEDIVNMVPSLLYYFGGDEGTEENTLDFRDYYLKSLEKHSIGNNFNEYIIGRCEMDDIKLVKTDKPKKEKLSPTAIHQEFDAKHTTISAKDIVTKKEPEVSKPKKKKFALDDMPNSWVNGKPDLTSSPNYQKALTMPSGKEREKTLNKALKAAKKAVKETVEV